MNTPSPRVIAVCGITSGIGTIPGDVSEYWKLSITSSAAFQVKKPASAQATAMAQILRKRVKRCDPALQQRLRKVLYLNGWPGSGLDDPAALFQAWQDARFKIGTDPLQTDLTSFIAQATQQSRDMAAALERTGLFDQVEVVEAYAPGFKRVAFGESRSDYMIWQVPDYGTRSIRWHVISRSALDKRSLQRPPDHRRQSDRASELARHPGRKGPGPAAPGPAAMSAAPAAYFAQDYDGRARIGFLGCRQGRRGGSRNANAGKGPEGESLYTDVAGWAEGRQGRPGYHLGDPRRGGLLRLRGADRLARNRAPQGDAGGHRPAPDPRDQSLRLRLDPPGHRGQCRPESQLRRPRCALPGQRRL